METGQGVNFAQAGDSRIRAPTRVRLAGFAPIQPAVGPITVADPDHNRVISTCKAVLVCHAQLLAKTVGSIVHMNQVGDRCANQIPWQPPENVRNLRGKPHELPVGIQTEGEARLSYTNHDTPFPSQGSQWGSGVPP